MLTFLPWFLLALVLVGLAGYLRVKIGPSAPRAESQPVDPSGGFATAEQVRAHLSEEAVRRAGAQVRPSMPVQQAPRRKGLTRGR